MSDLTGQNLRRFRSRDDDGGYRVANDGRTGTPRPIRRLDVPITQPFPMVATAEGTPSGDHVEDLIPGYALGALDADEKLAVERHADYCARCARFLADTRRTAAMLPYLAAPATPSPDVKATLFARIAQSSVPAATAQADEFAWARPVSPRRSVTLPASGSQPGSRTVAVATDASRSPRRKRSLRQMAGISIPVLLTFSLLALFVVPQLLPSSDPEGPELLTLLNAGTTECTDDTALALVTSSTLVSACGRPEAGTLQSGVVHWTLYVNNLRDDTPQPMYQVNIPMVGGGYETIATPLVVGPTGSGEVIFVRPENASDGQICITERGENANLVCQPDTLAPAA